MGPSEKKREVRALVVDDDPRARTAIRAELDDLLAAVAEAASTHAAVTEALLEAPDLVVLDVMMPGSTGIEALPLLVEAAPEAVIIVFTALDGPSVADAALEAGADAVVDKAHGFAALRVEVAARLGLEH